MDIRAAFMRKSKDIKSKSSKRFDDWSKKYDRSLLQFLIFRRSHNMFISNIVHDSRHINILDVGCGTGEFAMKLKSYKKDASVYGLDISSDMIRAAKAKFNGEIDFRVADVEHMPYEDNQFDYLTCSHSFHHYPHKKKAVREMHRILKNKGKIMIIDGCKDNLLGRVIFDVIVKAHEGDVHHLHSSQFARILEESGFKNVTQEIFNPCIPLLFTMGVAKKPA
ncbi:MAG: methyltransferase domain-containing protein [Candidatus Omnitrophica bacterium]|nr:methyltransferase domain-containing protein [Candidatus Omnitrophota bacterium]MBU4488456.1 methyltransferase domain-containing protein [Candidatus Omnitrophota bacterium]MCG2705652.1 methyltransferase domain-containing protein [Candidatus Omnitrophota bacterium]